MLLEVVKYRAFGKGQNELRNDLTPRKKMSAPTTMIGMNPMITGPTTKMLNVAAASKMPATRLSPPLLMNRMELV